MVEDPDEAEMPGRTRDQTKKGQEKEEQEAKHEKKGRDRQKRRKRNRRRGQTILQILENGLLNGKGGGGETPNLDQNSGRLLGRGEEEGREARTRARDSDCGVERKERGTCTSKPTEETRTRAPPTHTLNRTFTSRVHLVFLVLFCPLLQVLLCVRGLESSLRLWLVIVLV